MWDRLSHADLEAVKQRLKERREEILRRHAEELCALESDRAEIEQLDQLIDTFAKSSRSRRHHLRMPPPRERNRVARIRLKHTLYQASLSSLLKHKRRSFGSWELPTQRSGT